MESGKVSELSSWGAMKTTSFVSSSFSDHELLELPCPQDNSAPGGRSSTLMMALGSRLRLTSEAARSTGMHRRLRRLDGSAAATASPSVSATLRNFFILQSRKGKRASGRPHVQPVRYHTGRMVKPT